MENTEQQVIFKVAFQSNKGMVREANEDNLILNPDLTNQTVEGWTWSNNESNIDLSDRGAMLVVADGMGGMNAGEEASRIAVESVREYFNAFDFGSEELTTEQIRKSMFESILFANKEIQLFSKKNPESKGLGTTLVMVWLRGNVANVAWVGDSRVYLQRKGHPLAPLSRDHSLVQELVDAGKITEEQAFFHPDKNIITQSLGDSGHTPKPSFHQETILTGDRVMLCSDGLNTMVTDARIGELMADVPGVKLCAERLVNEANAEGGYDNITVIVCDVVQAPGGLPEPPPPAPVVNPAAVQATAATGVPASGAFENAAPPPPTPPPPMTPEKPKRISRLWIFGAGILLGLLLFAVLYFGVLSNDNETEPVENEENPALIDSSEVEDSLTVEDLDVPVEESSSDDKSSVSENAADGQTATPQNNRPRTNRTNKPVKPQRTPADPEPSEPADAGENGVNQGGSEPPPAISPAAVDSIKGNVPLTPAPTGPPAPPSDGISPSMAGEGFYPAIIESQVNKFHVLAETTLDKDDAIARAIRIRKIAKDDYDLALNTAVVLRPAACNNLNCYGVVLRSFNRENQAKNFKNGTQVRAMLREFGLPNGEALIVKI